jgi:Starch-binding associating with outer membrane
MITTIHPKNTSIACLLAVVVSLFAACDVSRFNENPNISQSGEASLEKLLPAALAKSAKLGAGQTAIYTGIFAQYFTGLQGNELQFEQYIVTELDANPLWKDAYEAMNLLNIISKKAINASAPHYSGIAKIMMAYSLGSTTTFWGDIPYNDAFRLSFKLNPAYDRQESIYNNIQNLLNDGIREINATQSTLKPSKDDVIFGGNMDSWRRAAYGLKARYYMHLASERSPKYSDSALICTNRSFLNSTVRADLAYQFTTGSEVNPLYEYFNAAPSVSIDSVLLKRMEGDPRKEVYFSLVNGKYKLGKYFNDPKAPLSLVTYEEVQLLEAEIYATRGAEYIEFAQAALQRAMNASIQKLNRPDGNDLQTKINEYMEKYGTLTTDANKNLEKIMHQQYILHFGQSEGWMDIRRRTAALKIEPNRSAIFNEIPKRLPYPEAERLYNASFPTAGRFGLQDRLWFDTK